MARKTTEKTSLAERAETAIVEKMKMETAVVSKPKAETAVVKKEKAETAVVKKEKAETAMVKKEKEQTALTKTEGGEMTSTEKKPVETKTTETKKAARKTSGTKTTGAKKAAAEKKPAAKKASAAKKPAAEKKMAEKKTPKSAKAGDKSKMKTGPDRDGLVYMDVVDYVREKLKAADAGVIGGRAAFQVDVTGQGSGIFYIEIVDGFLAVEPYDYRDRDARLVVSSDDLLDIVEKKLNFDKALTEGRLYVDGNWDRAMELKKLLAQL